MNRRRGASVIVARWALAISFVTAGVNHFVFPAAYAAIVPAWIPWAGAAVFWSGVAEIAGGIGVVIPALRRAAGWGLIALLMTVFPANVDAALHGMELFGGPVPGWVLSSRLPVQGIFVAWVWLVCLRSEERR